MKPPAPLGAKPATPKPPKDRPHCERGDEVYFHHEGNPFVGKVLSRGEHGATLELKSGTRHQMRWENYLGHRSRVQPQLSVVDQGEDGFVARAPGGRPRYVHDPLDEGDDEDLVKAFSGQALGRILDMREDRENWFTKAIKGSAGLTLQDVTTKAGVRTKRWKRNAEPAPKERPAAAPKPAAGAPPGHHDAREGQTVKFRAGDFHGTGKIVGTPGPKGTHVQDTSGRIHTVKWDEIHERDGAPAKKEPRLVVPAGKAKKEPPKGADGKADLHAMVADAKAQRERHAALVEKHGADDKPVKMAHGDGRKGLVSPDLQRKGGWRFTRMDGEGPSGHSEHGSKADALKTALGAGFEPHAEVEAKPKPDQHYVAPANFNAASYAKSQDDPHVTSESILSHFPPDTGAKLKAIAEKLAQVESTDQIFKGNRAEYTPERQALHRKILFDGITAKVKNEDSGEIEEKHFPGILSPEAIRAATPPDGQKPTFTMLGGRGGSGKSWFSNKKRGGFVDKDKAIFLDNDHIKGLLPEYDGWTAAQVHEEAGELFDDATAFARQMGLNVVHDATMKTAKKAVDLAQKFKDMGYRVEAHYMHLPRQEAAKRAVDRFLGPTQRYVPPDVVLGMTTNEDSFDQVRKLADKWSFRDNNVPRGHDPILISDGGND
ncbi:MAG TPA: zeta toxin family protein [Caulobacteraceae bacterium]|nr:zeta toxin family protein [Caulobacteraceae bacterium]